MELSSGIIAGSPVSDDVVQWFGSKPTSEISLEETGDADGLPETFRPHTTVPECIPFLRHLSAYRTRESASEKRAQSAGLELSAT